MSKVLDVATEYWEYAIAKQNQRFYDGDRAFSDEMNKLQDMRNKTKPEAPQKSLSTFKNELRKIIETDLLLNHRCGIGTDNYPDPELAECARIALLDPEGFPDKTNMWVACENAGCEEVKVDGKIIYNSKSERTSADVVNSLNTL